MRVDWISQWRTLPRFALIDNRNGMFSIRIRHLELNTFRSSVRYFQKILQVRIVSFQDVRVTVLSTVIGPDCGQFYFYSHEAVFVNF